MRAKSVDPRHKILKIPKYTHTSTTKLYILNTNTFSYKVEVHANCVCNELKALTNRHLVDRTYIKFDRTYWREQVRATHKFFGDSLSPVSFKDIIDGYTGAKKRTYYQASLNLRSQGWKKRYSVVQMFVKPDRYAEADAASKDPRAIQYRTAEYTLSLMRYIKAYEHHYYERLTFGLPSRVIAKGLNQYERADLFLNKAAAFNDPVFLSLDHSRFDSTVNIDHLKSIHKLYQKSFHSKSLQMLLACQLKNRCFSKGGIAYQTSGTRCSGDADTGCGNSLINALVLYSFLKHLPKFDFFLDGDDSVVIVESRHFDSLDFQHFERCGFETKMAVTRDIHQVDFCQTRLVLAYQPVMVRDPRRAISHANTIRRKYPNHTFPKLLSAVGECELATNAGVPVLQEFGRQLANISREKIYEPETRWKMGSLKPKVVPIGTHTRLSFYRAWGVTPAVQLAMESENFTSRAYCNEFNVSGDFTLGLKRYQVYHKRAQQQLSNIGKYPLHVKIYNLLNKHIFKLDKLHIERTRLFESPLFRHIIDYDAESLCTISRLRQTHESLNPSSSGCWWAFSGPSGESDGGQNLLTNSTCTLASTCSL